jgi:hypothetical protein
VNVPSPRAGLTPNGTSSRLLLCLLGACLWALPHVGWGSRAGVGVLGFIALAGSGLATLTLLVVALREWPRSEGAPLSAQALVLGLGFSLLPWSALAYWLAVATHHRPLGAVTFAVGATAGAVLAVLVARRTFAERSRSRALVALASCAALGALGLAIVAVRGVGADSALRSAVPDFGLGIVLALLAAFVPLAPSLARFSRAALLGCICLWGVTLVLMRLEPDVRATVKSVPVIAGVVGLAVR